MHEFAATKLTQHEIVRVRQSAEEQISPVKATVLRQSGLFDIAWCAKYRAGRHTRNGSRAARAVRRAAHFL